jgi:hypothetical protein
MIRIHKSAVENEIITEWVGEEYDNGRLAYHLDSDYIIFTFYYQEDEEMFILKFGKDFPAVPRDNGAFYCPYIPAGFK